MAKLFDKQQLIPSRFQVWDGTTDALITFNRDNFEGDVAFIVENDVLLYAIEREIAKNPNVTIRNESKIENVRLSCDGRPHNEVVLKSGEIITSELLVSKIEGIFLLFSEHKLYTITLDITHSVPIAIEESSLLC